ncbi:MAG: hypothetical protein IPG12_06240 [Saprospiraceae bacterium]|nr:hypothetical protein [Saprospiraceae bacterium]
MRVTIFKNVFYSIIVLSFILSCKVQESAWDTEILTPLVKTSLRIDQIVDNSYLRSDSSHLVYLVFNKSLYDLAIDSFFHFSDTSARRTFKIDSLSLYSSTVNYPISLGTLARNAGSTGQLLLFLHGTTQIIPAIPPITPGPVSINADTLFTTMTLADGKLDLTLFNGLPIDITNAQFELRNQDNGILVVSGSFPLIPVNTTVSQTFDLSGKTVNGKLVAQLISLSSPGSKGVPVLIDTSNSIQATLKVYDLHPSTATAIWPAQNLINSAYYFRLKGLPVELKESRIAAGKVRIVLYSTLQDSIKFTYKLPGAIKNGVPLEAYKVLEPAPPGGSSRFIREDDLAGYRMDLSGANGDSFNVAFNVVKASVDSTGIMKTFSTEDSIYVELGFIDMRPEYARGYLNDTILYAGPKTVELDFFNRIKSGKLQVDKASLSIDINNKIGVDMELKINELKSINNRTNTIIELNGSEIDKPISIERAKDQNGFKPIEATQTHVEINELNSNMTSFISNLPDKLSYSLQLQTNPLGNVSNHRDFIYDGEYMNLNMNLEIPLEIKATALSLSDTILMDLQKNDLSGIKSGTLHAFFNNGFPLETKVQLYLLNELNEITDTLLDGSKFIQAAFVNGNGKVESAVETRIDIPMVNRKVTHFLNARKMLIIVTFDSKPQEQHVKIFDSYAIDFQMTADFIYTVD